MSYQSQHDVATDVVFQHRVIMCVAEQSEIYANDGRLEYSRLAHQAIATLESVAEQFVPMVAVRPAITASSPDSDLLAAVQYLWPLFGAQYVPVGAPPIGMVMA